MIRAFAFASIALLAGCAASAQTASHPATHGVAYFDVRRIQALSEMRGFYEAYDREAASLKATQSVPQLTDTRGTAQRQGEVAKSGAREASNALAALRSRVTQYAPKEDDIIASAANASHGADAAQVRSQIENNYARQADAVRSKVAGSSDVYRAELARQEASALASYRASLDARVRSAYAARAQQLQEKEAELEINLDKKDVNQDLVLRVKLQNLKAPQVNRAALRAELQAMEGREDSAMSALRARDANTLASYRAKLDSQASRDYRSMVGELRRKADANWRLRQRVSQAQMQMPSRLSLTQFEAGSFGDQLVATATTLRDYVRTRFNGDADATASAFANASDDIAQRFATVGSMDYQARRAAANEIIALQHNRSALGDQLANEARTIARRLAEQRGLELSDTPRPGSIDLTTEVERQMRALFGS
jgi:hypothetical protein